RADVGEAVDQPGVVGHVGTGRNGARVEHVLVVPAVGVFAADARAVGADAARAPLGGGVVDGFAETGVVVGHAGAAVAEHVGHKGADHLRVAVVAAFVDVDVAAGEFQRRIGNLDTVLDVGRAVHEHRGHDLDESAGGDGHEGEHGEG